jgi:hypothetical protein
MAGTVAARTLVSEARWWSVLVLIALVASGSIAFTIVSAFVPQESSDRLRWWVEWLRHRERVAQRRNAEIRTPSRNPPRR